MLTDLVFLLDVTNIILYSFFLEAERFLGSWGSEET